MHILFVLSVAIETLMIGLQNGKKSTLLYIFILAKQKIVSEKQSYVLITNPLKLTREFISSPTKIPSLIFMQQ
ncbi:hypothetical protein DD594_26840, partial [Enterobacter cloacae complex sp. 4DZ1-17B1]|uniref:hypothetical protein n=1 Tax=Enterobacter cloacae complex sp. 4DZ1-17B1 TaxID=2511991 RepID=UPI001026C607